MANLNWLSASSAFLVVAVLLLGACQGVPGDAPAAARDRVSGGDQLELQRELTIAAGKASVILQNGRIMGGGSVDRFAANCRFVTNEIQSREQRIRPGKFIVTNVRYWEDMVALDYRIPLSGGEFVGFETTLRLHSEQQPHVHSLTCRHEDEHSDGRHLRLSEIQQALGNYAAIIKAPIQ